MHTTRSTLAIGALCAASALAPFARTHATAPSGLDLPADLVALVPSDAFGLVYIPALADAEEQIQEYVELVAPQYGMFASLDMLFAPLQMSGLDTSLIDLTQPLIGVIGAPSPMTGTPSEGYLILPSDDPVTLAQSHEDLYGPGSALVVGDYVGLTMMGQFPALDMPSPLLDQLFGSLFSCAFDVEPYVAMYSPMASLLIDAGLANYMVDLESDPDMPDAFLDLLSEGGESTAEAFKTFLASVSTASFTIDLDGSLLAFNYDFHFGDDSPMATAELPKGASFDDMLPFINTDAAANFAYGLNRSSLLDSLEAAFIDAMDEVPFPEDEAEWGDLGPFASPDEVIDAAHELIADSFHAAAAFGDGSAASFFQGSDKSSSSWYHGTQPESLRNAILTLSNNDFLAMLGLSLIHTRVDATLDTLKIDWDVEQLIENFELDEEGQAEVYEGLAEARAELGPFYMDRVELSLASLGKQTLLLLNASEDEVAQSLQTAKATRRNPSSEIERVKQHLGHASPFAYGRFDLSPMMLGLNNVAGITGGPKPFEGDPFLEENLEAVMGMYAGLSTEKLTFGFYIDSTDILRIAEIGNALED